MNRYSIEIPTILITWFMAWPAFGAGSIDCEVKKDILSKCKVNTGVIYGRESHLSDFQVKYSLSCDRNSPKPEQANIYFSLESGKKVYLTFGAKNQTLSLGEGLGPVVLGDDKPDLLYYRRFNECSLQIHLVTATLSQKIVSELETFIEKIKKELPEHMKKLVNYQSLMIAAAGAEPSMACMIYGYESSPIYASSLASVITDMKNSYFLTFSRAYDPSLYGCPWEGDLETELAACDAGAATSLCAFQILYLQEHSWFTTKLSEAVNRRADFKEGKAVTLLESIKSELNEALNAAETGIYR